MENIAGAVGTKDRCITRTFKFQFAFNFEQKTIRSFNQRTEFGIVLSYQECKVLWKRTSLI